MAETADNPKTSDYSCEILSFIVLIILSALSHFWYILFVFCAGIIFWGAVVLMGKVLATARRPGLVRLRPPVSNRPSWSGIELPSYGCPK
jgi:hypothetical protein